MNTPGVLVVGDLMRDLVVRLAGPLRPGTDQRASIDETPGGGGANLARWLAALGQPVRLLACVGAEDREAEAGRLSASGVEPALLGSRDKPTGRLVALVGEDGERSFLTDRGANDAWGEPLPLDALLRDVGAVHVSGYSLVAPGPRAAIAGLLAQARRAGLAIFFDPGSSGFLAELGAPLVWAGIGPMTVCCCGAEEAAVLTGTEDGEEQVRALAGRAAFAILKRGARGVRAGTPDGRRWLRPAPAGPVVDTIGAGDAFLAGVVAGFLAGADEAAMLDRGSAMAALALATRGGAPPVDLGGERAS